MKNIINLISLLLLSTHLFATNFYIDPSNGSNTNGDGSQQNPWRTLEFVINNNLIESMEYVTPYNPNNPQLIVKNSGAPIKANDVIFLYSGLHGEINLVNYINTLPVTIKSVDNNTPIIKKMYLLGAKNWVFDGLTVSSEPYGTYIHDKLIYLESHNWQGPVSDITISNCNVFSAETPWTDTSSWNTKVSDGIFLIDVTNINLTSNTIKNVRFGISMQGQFINTNGNSVINFSADAIRLLGSNNIIEKNTIKNCYKVDDNHDDGIQAFTTGGLVIDNNTIRKNFILNYEDPSQPLLGDLQGIGCYDGPLDGWLVENNVIIVDQWHGISLYGATNSNVINNTVLDPTPLQSPGPSWIRVDDDNANLASNCIVKNNVTNSINVTANTLQNNNVILNTLADYQQHFVDYQNNDYHLKSSSSLIDTADSNMAPADDFDENSRPQGNGFDIGAFENTESLSNPSYKLDKYILYPNPTKDNIIIKGQNLFEVKVYNFLGQDFTKYVGQLRSDNSLEVNLSKLKQGVYYIQLNSKVYPVVKE